MRGVLSALGVILIVAWLVLWLAVKVTFAAIHLILVLGVALLVLGLVRSTTGRSL